MTFTSRRRARGLQLFAPLLLGGLLLCYWRSILLSDWTSATLNNAVYYLPATEAIHLVLTHVGDDPAPPFLRDCIQQIRASNPIQDNVHIWVIIEHGQLLLSQLQLNCLEQPYFHLVKPQDLEVDLGSGQYQDGGIGFWAMTTQRILYIESLVRRENLRNVFMVESDNLLYMHLRHALPALQQNYPGVGATWDSRVRGIAGLTWFSGPEATYHFAQFIRERVDDTTNDSEMLADYISAYLFDPTVVSTFPVLPPWDEQVSVLLAATEGSETDSEETRSYIRNFDALNESIFDACAVGQYLMGIDHPRGQWTTGYLNPETAFKVNGWAYTWQMETYRNASSWTPFIVRNPAEPRESWRLDRINNIHVHHKNLGYQRALPEGPDIPANSLLFHPTQELGTQRGPWVERWNDQTNEFRSRIAAEPLMRQHVSLFPTHRPWSYPLHSFDGLRLIADHGQNDEDAAYFSRLDTAAFRPGTVVAVPSDQLDVFFSRPMPTVPYILISSAEDSGPTPEMIRHLFDNSNLRLWLAQNPTFSHPRLQPLPVGFKNEQYPGDELPRLLREAKLAHGPVGPAAEGVPLDAGTPSSERPQSQRDILLYVNLGETTPRHRPWIAAVTAWGKDRPDVVIVHDRLPFEQYMSDLRRSRYVLSLPPRSGLDYHSTWEALLMGAIPIVQHSLMDNLFVQHPVLLVAGPEEVTPELLEQWEPSSWTRPNMWSNTWYDKIMRAKQESVLEWNAKR